MERVFKKKWRFLCASSLIFLGVLLVYTLMYYTARSPSLFYYDSSVSVNFFSWLLNSYTAIVFVLFGLATFLVPVFFLYISCLCLFPALFKKELVRLISSVLLLLSTSFLGSVLAPLTWRHVHVNGGVVGTFLARLIFYGHVQTQFLLVSVLILVCVCVLTRFWVLVPFVYCAKKIILFAQRKHVKKKFVSACVYCALACVRGVRAFVLWCYALVCAREKKWGLTQEQHEHAVALHDIVDDVYWRAGTPLSQDNSLESGFDEQKPYTLPTLALPAARAATVSDTSNKELQEQAHVLEQKLAHFNIHGSISAIKVGPVLTCFEYKPAIDTKLSKISALEDDLALALQAQALRVIAPIPGTDVVGFEVAHEQRRPVYCASVMHHELYTHSTHALPVIVGVDPIGSPVIIDLAKAPHMLIAGSTGSGKSVLLNSILVSLLCKKTPDELSLILIDPKRLEFAAYGDIPHLLFPIINTTDRAVAILQWLATTMNKRYEQLAAHNARSLVDFHERGGLAARMSMPYIVVVIDELADLMIMAGKHVESSLTRIAQMARAAGIHLIVATQRPSVDIITGLIKVNFPTRIALRVASAVDSRTIIDASGAQNLLGRGDLLMLSSQNPQILRAHATYISDEEILGIVTHIKHERQAHYISEQELTSQQEHSAVDAQDQHLYQEVSKWLGEVDEISISLLQRRFRIGYNRSARIIEVLEQQGRVSPADGGKTRRVVRSE